jgi:SAM-dependent methyltransferase
MKLSSRIKSIVHSWKHPGKMPTYTYNKYPPNSTFNGQKVLNLGCGNTTFAAPNVVNLDMYPRPGINCVWDLSKTPLPFEDNTFDLIIANHVLEHIPGWWDCFKELARVVKVGGEIKVWLPGDGGSSQLGYRDHINVINSCSFAGTRSTCRNNANAWEDEDAKSNGFIKDLLITQYIQTPYHFWWIYMLPDSLIMWLMDHLRNLTLEQGWTFVKQNPK